jgi:DNA-binding transcriptional LysR family regulator
MPDLRHFRYFATLAEELHFGRAAARLHITQPGLSQQIQALEREIGVPLLDRTSRRVRLTAAGQTLFEESRRMLAQVERVVTLTRRTGAGDIGRLAIGAVESATYTVLPKVLREYGRLYPGVQLVMREMLSVHQIEALRRGEIDVGFARTPIETDELATLPLGEESLAVMLPAGHPLCEKAEVPLAALAKEPFILHPTPPSNWASYIVAVCKGAGFEPRIAHEATVTTVAISFVAAELGITFVPASLAEGESRAGVVARPVASEGGHVPLTRLLVVYRKDALSPTAERLLEVARQVTLSTTLPKTSVSRTPSASAR